MSLEDSNGADPGKQSLLWGLPSLTGGWRGGTLAPSLFKGRGSDFREELLGNWGAPDVYGVPWEFMGLGACGIISNL